MYRYERPSVLSLTTQDLTELFGPAETQYLFQVVSSNPFYGQIIGPDDNISLRTNGTILGSSVSAADLSLKFLGDSANVPFDVSIFSQMSFDDSLFVNPAGSLEEGDYLLMVPVSGQQLLSTTGQQLAAYALHFTVSDNPPNPTDTYIALNNGACIPGPATTINIPVFVHLGNASKSLGGIDLTVTWNPSVLSCNGMTPEHGTYPFDASFVASNCHPGSLTLSVVQSSCITCGQSDYLVTTIPFTVLNPGGSTDICISAVGLLDTNGQNIKVAEKFQSCYNKESSGCPK